MERFAKAVTSGLARLTFATLHQFEKLGVNMATVDQAIADWTEYARGLKEANEDAQGKLQAALDEIQRLKDTDAAEDAQQIADAVAARDAAVTQQLEDALAALKDVPAPPDSSASPADPYVPDPSQAEPGLSGDQDPLNPGVPGDTPNELPATPGDETTPPAEDPADASGEVGPGTTEK